MEKEQIVKELVEKIKDLSFEKTLNDTRTYDAFHTAINMNKIPDGRTLNSISKYLKISPIELLFQIVYKDDVIDIDSLYHYTSIDALEHILKSRKFRFTSLAKVDDKSEVKTSEFESVGVFCFVNSWTDEVKENMPLWVQYADNMKGVRIKLPLNPFKQYPIHKDVIGFFDEYLIGYSDQFEGYSIFKEYADLNLLLRKNYIPIIFNNQFINKIIYTDTKINPSIYEEYLFNEEYNVGKVEEFVFSKIGLYKYKSWEFQKEIRYKFFILPMQCIVQNSKKHLRFKDVFENKINFNLDYIDLELSDEAYQKMFINIGPKNFEQNVLRVKNLFNQYNPSIQYSISELTNTIT